MEPPIGWTAGKKITIPANSIDADLSSFPLPVYLNNTNFDFTKCKADGSDIRFTDKNLNPLKFERKEHFNATSKATYNVQVPTITDLTDTEIYMWYGNPNAYNASMEAWQDMTGKQLTYNGNVNLGWDSGLGRRVAKFDGSGDYFSLADSEDWNYNNDFCMEYDINFSVLPTTTIYQMLYTQRYSNSTELYLTIRNTAGVYSLNLGNYNNSINFSTNYAFVINTRYKITVSREGNVFRMFVNGVQIGSNYTNATALTDVASLLYIGCYLSMGTTPANFFNGNIYGLRITKGRGRYTTTFTPPTTFDIDGTDVVFCSNFDTVYDSNYAMVQHMGDTLVDASGNGNNGTNFGTTVVDTEFGKARSFDGNGYITIPHNLALKTTHYTLSALIKPSAYPTDGWGKSITQTSEVGSYLGRTLAISDIAGHDNVVWANHGNGSSAWLSAYGTTIIPLSGYSVAHSSHNVTSLKAFLNGIMESSIIGSASVGYGTTPEYIGANYGLIAARKFNGIMSERRNSNIARSDAWVKAESLGLKNELLLIEEVEL